MLNADPVNPVWRPTCPWDPGYGRLGGGGGGGWRHFVSWVRRIFCRLGTRQKTVSTVTGRHRRIFGIILAHRTRVRVAQISYYNNVGWFHPSVSGKSRFTGFWRGLGDLKKFRTPTDKKSSEPKNSKNMLKPFFCCGSKIYGFVGNGAIFFRFRPLLPPLGAVRTEKAVFRPKQNSDTKKGRKPCRKGSGFRDIFLFSAPGALF